MKRMTTTTHRFDDNANRHASVRVVRACMEHMFAVLGHSDDEEVVMPLHIVNVDDTVAVCMRDYSAAPGKGDRWLIAHERRHTGDIVVIVSDATAGDAERIADAMESVARSVV